MTNSTVRSSHTPTVSLRGPVHAPHWQSCSLRGTREDVATATARIAHTIAASIPHADVDVSDAWTSVVHTGGAPVVEVRARLGQDPDTFEILTLTTGSRSPVIGEDAWAAARRVPFTDTEMRDLHDHMPLTSALAHRLPSRVLSTLAPVLTVHHMRDFLVMIDTIRALGVPAEAITVLDKGYRYTHTARVDAHLRDQGITVHPWDRAAHALEAHARRAASLGLRGLLIDDGGYTLPVLMDELPHLVGAFTGLVEQTTSGITRLAGYPSLPVPVFSVAQSRLKSTIESYGIADAAVRNVLRWLPDEKWEGRPALVIGFGRIGEQLAHVLRDRRMRVAVHDAAIVRVVAAHEHGFVTGRSLSALLAGHRPLLVVGSTGRTSIRGEHAAALRRDCYLVSTTSRQHEFALDELTDEAVAVHDAGRLGARLDFAHGVTATVVGDGLPINFHYAESLPERYADLILAALVTGAAHLAAPDHGFALGHNVAATDRVLEGSGLLEAYYERYGPDAP